MPSSAYLKSLRSDRSPNNPDGDIVAVFALAHSNPATTLRQRLTFIGNAAGWKAEIALDDFPVCASLDQAALTLQGWLERLATALEELDFSQVTLDDPRCRKRMTPPGPPSLPVRTDPASKTAPPPEIMPTTNPKLPPERRS